MSFKNFKNICKQIAKQKITKKFLNVLRIEINIQSL